MYPSIERAQGTGRARKVTTDCTKDVSPLEARVLTATLEVVKELSNKNSLSINYIFVLILDKTFHALFSSPKPKNRLL